MTPPDVFVADLAAYDPDLRVRWSRHRAALRPPKPLWIIERKLPERHAQLARERPTFRDLERAKPKTLKNARVLDLWEGWTAGYVHVMDVHPDLLTWSQVGPVLAKADAWRQGGMDQIARQFEEQDAADEARRERHAANVIADRLDGVYDQIVWANRQRVNVPVEVKDGFVVQDRRLVSA